MEDNGEQIQLDNHVAVRWLDLESLIINGSHLCMQRSHLGSGDIMIIMDQGFMQDMVRQ